MGYFDFTYWNEFLSDVRAAEDQLQRPAAVWYRGVNDEGYHLSPSLLRRSNGLEKEEELFNKYRLLAKLVHEERRSDWQYLFDMQHYRIPTRLLDWTEVLGIAVFFALIGGGDGDAAVYILDPLALNMRSGKRDIPSVYEDTSFDYKEIYWRHKPVPAVFPVAIQAPAQNSRILAQRGKFTVHGTEQKPIDEQFPELVKKVRLPRKARDSASEFLRIAGINEFSVFPDVVGLAPFLEDIVGIRS